ncbi:hypothetical protein [Rhodococcus zopfii]|uniref:hypothetical protein n=1 Tax=Rhodococcus zopfii TaxID=43772 RepID=UPI001F106ABC|nr:hypothetical protein [Rhodococcus zopfii]
MRQFELIDHIRDEQGSLRGCQHRNRKQPSEVYTAATCVVVDSCGRSGSSLDGLAIPRVGSQDCFDHRASRKRKAAHRFQTDQSGRAVDLQVPFSLPTRR